MDVAFVLYTKMLPKMDSPRTADIAREARSVNASGSRCRARQTWRVYRL